MDTAQYWFQAGDAASDYQIERSLRFNSADSAYLNRIPASAGNRKTWSVSFWLKRSALGTYQMPFSCYQSTGGALGLFFNTDNTLEFYQYNAAYQMRLITSQVFRDPSSWYHFVFSVDTTQATASNRVKIYVNGAQITAFSTATYPSQNEDLIFNYAQAHAIGMYASNNQYYFDGLITEFHNIDGQALTPSSFGKINPVTGVWQPKKYTGTYGTNGFYLKFADNSGTTSTTLGKDSSGNGNNWTPNNFSVTAGSGNDSLIDTPTPYADGGNGRGNYATWNPVAGNMPISNGALYAYNPAAYYPVAFGTIKIGTNFSPIYWEGVVDGWTSQSSGITWGLTAGDSSVTGAGVYGSFSDGGNSLVYSSNGGTLFYPGGIAAGTILQFAFNPSTGNIWLGKNNAWYDSSGGFTGNPAAGANPTTVISGTALTPYVQAYANGLNVNFGQRPFAYTPPSGFLALNTQNLPEPTIKKPSSYMSVVTGTGANILTAAQGKLLTGAGLIWIKDRANGNNHQLIDTVRGGTLTLQSNTTGQETTYSAPSGNSVAWCWDESARPGFDIVTWTAQATAGTVAHSLGVAPKFIVLKSRDNAAYSWFIYHSDVGIQKYLQFSAAASTTNSTTFTTAPTSTVFDPGLGLTTGNGYNAVVAYLWSEVAGFSKFGSYTGNGSSDGPFVFCGFRPRYVLMKRTDADADWFVVDAVRNSYNAAGKWLSPNNSAAEYDYDASYPIDILSNGFKIRTSVASLNVGTFIYAAFAESPFKYSLAR